MTADYWDAPHVYGPLLGSAEPSPMIYRIIAAALFYSVLPLASISLGLVMLLAPSRVGRFVHENVISLPEAPQPVFWGKLFLRVAGVGLTLFGARFILNLAALFR